MTRRYRKREKCKYIDKWSGICCYPQPRPKDGQGYIHFTFHCTGPCEMWEEKKTRKERSAK